MKHTYVQAAGGYPRIFNFDAKPKKTCGQAAPTRKGCGE